MAGEFPVSGYADGGVIPGPGGEHGDEVPALLSGGCGYVISPRRLSQQQLEQFAERIGAAALKPPRFLTPLPRRVRARLAVTRAVDGAAVWLIDRGHFRAAGRLWHAFGMCRQ
jgi:hypothetical protein